VERLIVARHGESEYSAAGLVNGDPAAGVGLTPRGRDEARRLGEELACEPLDLCVVTALPRTRATAELALAGREVPIEEWPLLGDPRAGRFEGAHLAGYRRWAWSAPSSEDAPGDGESRLAVVDRYAEAWHALLDRPEPAVLAVVHALPIAYLLLAREGTPPPARVDLKVEHARTHRFAATELRAALAVIDAWRAEPTW
jgi:broad specificity phosphatase PhoE